MEIVQLTSGHFVEALSRHNCPRCTDDDAVIEVAPIGGGFVRHVPLADIAVRNATLPDGLIKARVGFDVPEWGVYDAYIHPVERWNGWLMPLMGLDAVRQFGETQHRLVMGDEGFEDWVEVSDDGIVTAHHTDMDPPFHDWWEIAPTVVNGIALYDMGLGLCWQEYKDGN